jgi:hypothetical protein
MDYSIQIWVPKQFSSQICSYYEQIGWKWDSSTHIWVLNCSNTKICCTGILTYVYWCGNCNVVTVMTVMWCLRGDGHVPAVIVMRLWVEVWVENLFWKSTADNVIRLK